MWKELACLFVSEWDGSHSQPLNVVLGFLRDEMNALQDIGDVVNASLLDVQHLWSPVQVHHAIRRLSQQVQEALGGEVQGCIIAWFLRAQSGYWGQEDKNMLTWLTDREHSVEWRATCTTIKIILNTTVTVCTSGTSRCSRRSRTWWRWSGGADVLVIVVQIQLSLHLHMCARTQSKVTNINFVESRRKRKNWIQREGIEESKGWGWWWWTELEKRKQERVREYEGVQKEEKWDKGRRERGNGNKINIRKMKKNKRNRNKKEEIKDEEEQDGKRARG